MPTLPCRTLAAALSVASCAHAGSAPDYGFDWVTIGAPGNRGALAAEVPNDPGVFVGVGAVGYRYRMARTEVSGDKWYEFVQAFAPHVGSLFASNSQFTGNAAVFQGFSNGVPQYAFNAAATNAPVSVGWMFAARYCNWLHNDKALTADAFVTGAYDLPVLGAPATEYPEHHLENARFWIPSLDEWAKATHYDPNRYGEGAEGYWTHPDASDSPLTPGPPGTPGAETSAGWSAPPLLPLGSYPDVLAPWGLLDVSGGGREWIEDFRGGSPLRRFIGGSDNGDLGWQTRDRLDGIGFTSSIGGAFGFRLASAVPEPGGAVTLLAFAASGVKRRR